MTGGPPHSVPAPAWRLMAGFWGRSGGSTDSEEDEEDEEDVEEEGQAVCGGAGPPSHSSVSPQSLGR